MAIQAWLSRPICAIKDRLAGLESVTPWRFANSLAKCRRFGRLITRARVTRALPPGKGVQNVQKMVIMIIKKVIVKIMVKVKIVNCCIILKWATVRD